jgi:hypothetical protein
MFGATMPGWVQLRPHLFSCLAANPLTVNRACILILSCVEEGKID